MCYCRGRVHPTHIKDWTNTETQHSTAEDQQPPCPTTNNDGKDTDSWSRVAVAPKLGGDNPSRNYIRLEIQCLLEAHTDP